MNDKPNFHARMVNLPTPQDVIEARAQEAYKLTEGWMDAVRRAYRYGHRDARHAAAEVALEADSTIAELRETIRRLTSQVNGGTAAPESREPLD